MYPYYPYSQWTLSWLILSLPIRGTNGLFVLMCRWTPLKQTNLHRGIVVQWIIDSSDGPGSDWNTAHPHIIWWSWITGIVPDRAGDGSVHSLVYLLWSNQLATVRGKRIRGIVPVVVLRVDHLHSWISKTPYWVHFDLPNLHIWH